MKKLEIKEGKKIVTVTPLEDSYTYQGVGEIDTLVLSFEVPNHVELNVGAEVVVEGVRYTLMRPQDLTMYHTQHYSYRATFYGDGERTRLYKVQNQIDGRLEFTLTAKPHEHLQMLVDIMNARDKEGGWKVGSVPERAEVMIPYNHTTVLGGLQQLADKLETEWSIDEKTLHIGKLDGGTEEPLALRYGEGNGIRPEVKRLASDEYPVRRVYVQTGERNIDPAKYGGKRLHLPKSVSTAEYSTDAKGTYVELNGASGCYRDESVDLKHVYPMREGVVSSVTVTKKGQVDFADSSIPENLDYSKYQIPDEVMKVVFQSGMLAGRDGFEVHKYIHTSRTFQLVQREEDGITMPSGSFLPKVGDKYAVFGCALPDEYIRKAEEKLLEEALKVLHEERDDKFEIRAEIDGIWASKKWGEVAHKLKVGKSVLFSDPEWLPEPTKIRIVGVKRYLSRPFSPEVELANSVSSGSFSSLIRKVEGEQVIRREETRQSLIKLQDRTYKDTEAVREMVEKLKVEEFSKSLKPETLQTMYAVIGSPALQFEFVGGGFSWTEGKGGAITIPRQTIRQRVAGTTLEPEPKTKETTIPALTYTLKPDEQQAHIYVELKPAPRYVVSTKPLQITPDRLLVGLLNGAERSRDFTPLYGFTEISPSHIATRYIRSRSGNMLIDLETGNIYSDKIEFRRPDGSTKSVEEVITDTVQVGGRNLALRTQQPRRLSAGYAYYMLSECLIKDTDYTIQFDVEVLTPPEDNRFMVYFAYSTHLFTRIYIPFESGKTHYSATLKTPNKDGAIVDGLKSIYIYPHGWSNGADTVSDVTLSNMKLERGTVVTDWSPAPEDVQASIENEAKAREEGDKAQADSTQTLRQALDALRESGANDNATLTDLINKANQRLDNLQEQADGEVSNWFYPGAPAPNKAPENEWTTNGLKARHIGDTYTSTDESGEFMGKSWRYTTEFKWQEIHDTLVSQALAQASKAQTTADGKSTTFLVKPTKYEEGDTWVMESSQVVNGISYEAGTMLFAKQGSSAFVESHWVDKVRYIGATQLKESEEASKRAWEAYANAQAEAERVKAEAHADGIVTAEEQARINATNKALETAKAYAEAQDKLLEERQKAYADGVLTEAEKRAIDVAEKQAKLAETNAKAYSDGVLTEAEKKAIAQAQKAYDDAVAKAKDLDGQIQVGGRNLALRTQQPRRLSAGYAYYMLSECLIKDTDYTIQFDVEVLTPPEDNRFMVYFAYSTHLFTRIYIPFESGKTHYSATLKTPNKDGAIVDGLKSIYIYPHGWSNGADTVSDVTLSNMKLERGTVVTDWSPAPEDIQADIDKEAQARATAVQEINAGLTNANTLIDTLDKAQKQLEQGVLTKADTKDIQYLLDSLKNGKTQVAGGLVLTNDIILSDPNSKDVTAMISGTQTEGAKAMRLGIDYGGDKIAPLYEFIGASKTYEIRDLPTREEQIKRINELGYTIYRIQKVHEDSPTYWLVYRTEEKKDIGEATAFNNNGTGHIGELFFNGNYIGFGDALNSYMQVGGTARAESDMVNASTEMVTELMGATDASKSGRFSIRRLHSFTGFRDITLDLDLTLEAKARAARSKYGNDTGNLRPTDPKNPSGRYDDNYVFYESRRVTMRATIEVLHTRVDGVVVKTLKSEQVSVQAIAPGGSGEDLTRSPELLFGESELNKKVQFVIQSKDLRKGDGLEVFLVTERVGDNDYGCEGRASAKLVVTYPKDTSTPEVRITQDKTSFFYGRSKYMLLNYDNLIAKIVGDVLMQGNLNIKGTITADSYQGNGMPLAGATFNSSGGEVRALGRYKNKRNASKASAGYDYSYKTYTVYHSIPHDKYIPLVTPFGTNGNNGFWNLSVRIYEVKAYSFTMMLLTNQDNPTQNGFSYVAFQAE